MLSKSETKSQDSAGNMVGTARRCKGVGRFLVSHLWLQVLSGVAKLAMPDGHKEPDTGQSTSIGTGVQASLSGEAV